MSPEPNNQAGPLGGGRSRGAQVSAKSKLGEAIRYALTRWDGLSRFIDDGRIDLDNNTVERSIRPLALNRKNALFAGSDEGGDNWAVIATLIECCKLNAINPHEWLTHALTSLANGHPANSVSDLMPWTAVALKNRLRHIEQHVAFYRAFGGQLCRSDREYVSRRRNMEWW